MRLPFLFLAAFAVAVVVTAPAADTATDLLAAAGNAAGETERLAVLRRLAGTTEPLLDATSRRELDGLLPVVEAWAEGRARAERDIAAGRGEAHRYLHGFFNNATRPFDPPFPAPPRVESPLYPLWAFYRGRFLTWYMMEHSDVLAVPERKARFIAEAERCFDLARRAFPANPALAIYTGETFPAADLSPPDDRAPAWASEQRHALEQLHRIIRWWIAERQLPNGEFGGNWGDDVEMWRWWAPILIGFDDPVVTAAQERLARGNLARPALAAGYTSQLTDVEHTAEETADTLTPMLHAAGPTPEWTPRVLRLVELARNVWWGTNERGGVQFRHIDFNHERIGPDATRAYDTGYHVRALQPALLLWQRTNDPALGASLTRWLRTWAEAAVGTDNGKPAGIVPAALAFPSGRVGSSTRGWIGPDLGDDPMQSIYSWPGYPVTALTAALLQAHVQTRDPLFLRPLEMMAELRRRHLATKETDAPSGSAAWAAERLPAVLNPVLAKWRQVSGETRFDDLLRADAGGYVRFLLSGNQAELAAALAGTARTLSVNWPLFTSEVRFTDRVLSFPRVWPRAQAADLQRVDTDLLYSMVTGDPAAVDYFPLNGVRWHTLPENIAVLVTENRRDAFAAQLYPFGPDARSLDVSLLTLEAGTYTWSLTGESGRILAGGEWTVASDRRRFPLVLPPATRSGLKVSRRH